MSGGGLADEGWHFFHPASSFVSSLRLMKLAFQLPPGPDTQTPKGLSHPIHKVEQRAGVAQRHLLLLLPPAHVKNTSTLDVSDKLPFTFTAYSLSNPQTCLFLLKQQASIIQTCFFSVSVACLYFFPLCALRSPTNELNTEETWKRLDEAWLSEQQGDDIVPHDYTHLYQQ